MYRAPHLAHRLVLLGACLALAGCAALRSDPEASETRRVTEISDPSKTVSVLERVVWMNGPLESATRGVRLPIGRYSLEAEDDEFLYFGSPERIEVRVLEAGRSVDGRDVRGGLALAKDESDPVPAAAYVDAGPGEKTLIFKRGPDFLATRGSVWNASF